MLVQPATVDRCATSRSIFCGARPLSDQRRSEIIRPREFATAMPSLSSCAIESLTSAARALSSARDVIVRDDIRRAIGILAKHTVRQGRFVLFATSKLQPRAV